MAYGEVQDMQATRTAHVEAAPERVMAFIVDSTATPPNVTMEVVYETPDVVGNAYTWSFKVFGIRGRGVTVYTEYVPGQRLGMRNVGTLEGTSTHVIEPESGGSNLTIDTDSRLSIPLVGRFLDPLLRRGWNTNLDWLIQQLEKETNVEKAIV